MPADTHTPVPCQHHEQAQAIPPLRHPEWGIRQLKPPTLESGTPRVERPPGPVILHSGFGRLTGHRDAPGCRMPGFMPNAHVGRDPAGKPPQLGPVAFADSRRQFARGGFTHAGLDGRIF